MVISAEHLQYSQRFWARADMICRIASEIYLDGIGFLWIGKEFLNDRIQINVAKLSELNHGFYPFGIHLFDRINEC